MYGSYNTEITLERSVMPLGNLANNVMVCFTDAKAFLTVDAGVPAPMRE